jgi:hypothetical protein
MLKWMPLEIEIDIDNFVLSEASDGEDRCLFLLDPATGKNVGHRLLRVAPLLPDAGSRRRGAGRR